MINRILYAGIAALLAVVLLFSNLTITPPYINGDEANNGIDAVYTLETGDYRPFYQNGYGREGMNIWLSAQAIKYTGLREPWVLRLPSMAFGVLLVVAVYFLIIEVLERMRFKSTHLWGFLGSMLMLTSFWYIALSRISFTGTFAAFFAATSILFLLYAERTGKHWYMIPASLMLGLGVYSYMPFKLMPLVLLPLIITAWKRLKYPTMWLYLLGATLIASPMIGYALSHPDHVTARANSIQQPVENLPHNTAIFLDMFAGVGDPSWLQNIPGRPFLGLILTFSLIIGIYTMWMKYRSTILATLVLLIGLGAVAHIMGSPEPYFLRFMIAIPAVFVLITVGIAVLTAERTVDEHLLTIGILIIVAARLLAVSSDYQWWSKQPQVSEAPNTYERIHWEQAGEVAKLLEHGDVYIQTASQHFAGDANDLPVVSPYVLYRIGAWDSVSAKRKGLHFINALVPSEVNSIPVGATVYYM